LIASSVLAGLAVAAARALWATAGSWRKLGWDAPDAGFGARVATLRDRLPNDLRDASAGPEFDALPFVSLYQLEDEYAAEFANRTVHGVMEPRMGSRRRAGDIAVRWLST